MIPKSIKLDKNKKILLISYDNEKNLILKSSFLRVSSPSAENKHKIDGYSEKFQDVGIKEIKKVGNYAIRIVFDDGHSTGIYSWQYLFELGIKFQNLLDP